MTGGEIIAAGVGVGKAVLGKDSSTKKQLAAMAAETPEMKAAAAAYARRVLLKQQILLRVYEPLAKLVGVSREYFERDFAAELAEKITNIPDENITTPSPSVAVPAMEGLARSLSEPSLKEMYLNLLAAATDDRRIGDAHPSFAEIIKQLSAEEAGLLSRILRQPRALIPIARVHVDTRMSGRRFDVGRHIVHWEGNGSRKPLNPEMGPVYVDNWIRLGLVDVSYHYRVAGSHRYDWIKNEPEIRRLQDEYSSLREVVRVVMGKLTLTDFGERFGSAVLGKPPEELGDG
jgi:Abortive infection alpha